MQPAAVQGFSQLADYRSPYRIGSENRSVAETGHGLRRQPSQEFRGCYGTSPSGSGTNWMRPLPAVSASWPCLRASASAPNTSRRQPRRAGHRGAVVGGDRSRGRRPRRELLRDPEILAALLQQHAQQFDQRADAGRRLGLRRDRRRRVGVGDALATASRMSRPSLPSATPLPRLRVRPRLSIVFGACAAISISASSRTMRPARDVALLRRRLAPCRHRPQDAEKAPVGAPAQAKPPPRLIRLGAVDRRVDEVRHLLGEPWVRPFLPRSAITARRPCADARHRRARTRSAARSAAAAPNR